MRQWMGFLLGFRFYFDEFRVVKQEHIDSFCGFVDSGSCFGEIGVHVFLEFFGSCVFVGVDSQRLQIGS